MFYLAGAVNVFLGLYVVIEGTAFLERETVTWLTLFFLVFAAIDFWFPRQLKKKWEREQALRGGAPQQPGSRREG